MGVLAAAAAVAAPPQVVVADLPSLLALAATPCGASNEAQVVGVAALVAALAHALHKVVADRVGAALCGSAIVHLQDKGSCGFSHNPILGWHVKPTPADICMPTSQPMQLYMDTPAPHFGSAPPPLSDPAYCCSCCWGPDLTLLSYVRQVMAEAAQQATVALVPQIIKTDACKCVQFAA